jgi:hypothetical protein
MADVNGGRAHAGNERLRLLDLTDATPIDTDGLAG